MRTAAFGITAFLAAALLFLVQPMAAKMALPVLGGSASVWTTAMLFFQVGLLAGYAWVHLLARRLAPRGQVGAHLALLAAAALLLPPGLTRAGLPPVDASPALWLLVALAVGFGLPYVAVAATGPLVQRWFASTDDPRASDPYFLYAASNAGSFAGLLLYPLLVEPRLPARALGTAAGAAGLSQAGAWSASYGALALLIAGCAGLLLAGRTRVETRPAPTPAPTWRRRALWAALALVPSSATIATTQHISTDLAAVPLLWVVPLAIYLLTFVLAFAPRVRLHRGALATAYGVLAVATACSFYEPVRAWGLPVLVLPLATLFALGLLLHGRLAEGRPDREHLTEYYLAIAVGGALGGVFNAIVAPSLFSTVAEYPIALALAVFLGAPKETETRRPGLSTALDAAAPIAVALAAVVTSRLVPTSAEGARWTGWLQTLVPALIALGTIGWPRRFAWSLTALLAAAWVANQSPVSALHRDRSFYGVHRVVRVTGPSMLGTDASGRQVLLSQKLNVLVDGVTRHGSQPLDPERRRVPTTYYHPSGPLGDVVRALRLKGPVADVGVVGLGAGTIAAYGEPGERFTFFEIDPKVAAIARDARLFTYITDARAETTIVLGDGRRSLAARGERSFDLIVVDAFSSDAIPAHLITREALALYLSRLKPGGCVAFHLTNRYLALDPVLGAIAADLSAPAAVMRDTTLTPQQIFEGKDLSKWGVVGTPGSRLPVEGSGGWSKLVSDPAAYPARAHWTDDRSDVVGLLFGL
jgi:SAM-dependent methyltransferase